MVVCTTENLASQNQYGYSDQTKFAKDVTQRLEQDKSLADVPLILLLITNGQGSQLRQDGIKDFPAVITCSDYTPAALEDAARVMFGS